jgi:catechol 2,3-dioxygenase-like lactoylglutathione lyase family enzyme
MRRLEMLRAVALSWLLAAAAAGNAAPADGTPRAAVSAVESVSLTVSDMDRAVRFYSDVLAFRKISDREVSGKAYEQLWNMSDVHARAVRLQLGDEQIELVQFLNAAGRGIPADSRSNDRWFQHVAIIVSDMNAAYQRLGQFNVRGTSRSPQRLPAWNRNAAGIEAYYFRDPDDHNLEVLAFPADKGAPKWHVHDGRLFLGIDHTAIVVHNTEQSLSFYRDALGLHVAGKSENYGPEQETLNNVPGAHLRITALRAPRGLGIEFLEYVSPADGRGPPADSAANDLWYWQINLCTDRLTQLQVNWPTPLAPTTALPPQELGWQAALITRDPDGHANFIGESPACTGT